MRLRLTGQILLLGCIAILSFQNCSSSTGSAPGTTTPRVADILPSAAPVSQSTCQPFSYSGLAISGATKGNLYSHEALIGSDIDYLISQWRKIDGGLGLVYANSGNRDIAYLGNNQGAMLSSYLEMYRATQDFYYLNRFIEQADYVLLSRDDRTGARDYSGRVVPAWSTYHQGYVSDEWRSQQKGYAFLIESGELTYPLADFAQLVLRGPDCLKTALDKSGRAYSLVAKGYVTAVEQTFTYHHEMFHADTVNGLQIGWYGARADIGSDVIGIEANREYPINYQTSFGRTIVSLWLATGKSSYREIARLLGNFLLLEMVYKTNGSQDWYEWSYWPQMSYYPGRVTSSRSFAEDFAHASVTYDFVGLLRSNVGVFYDTEMSRLARSFTLRFVSSPSERYFNINRTDLRPSSEHPASLLYFDGSALAFSSHDPSIPNIVYDSLISILSLHYGSQGTTGMKSYSQLLRYWADRFRTEGVSIQPSSAAGKKCPWGKACTSDGDCLSNSISHFSAYSSKVADNSCYSIANNGAMTYSSCIRDPPTKSWIGDLWIYTSGSSSSVGVACENPGSSSVWTWSTSNRTLVSCARKYICQ